MKIGIVMPILNQHRLALEAYASMRSRFDLEFFPRNNWINNQCVASSWNIGIIKALNKGCGLIIVANDDILVSKYAIDRMAVAMYSHPDIALLTGKDYRDEVGPDEISNFDPKVSMYDDNYSIVTDYAFFMIRPAAYVDIGPFDVNFTPAYFEDNDYHYRIKLSDWSTYQLKTAAFYHYGSTTQNSGNAPICSSPQFEANKAYYVKKWGGVPDAEVFTEPFGGTISDTGITI